MFLKFFSFLLLSSLLASSAVVEAIPLSKIFQRVNPAVVEVLTSQHDYSRVRPGEKVYGIGLGSGVVISKDGLVVTAAHVVQVADFVSVRFLNGRKVSAKILNSVVQADVALLQLENIPDDLVVAKLGNSDKVSTGDEVFVVGAPYGMNHTLTVGHISSRRRPKDFSGQMVPIEFLQTDASINKGNSGGPLFSMDGKVIGIVSHILSLSGGFEGLGFAVSINTVKELLLKKKSFWSGLDFYFITGELAKALNVPQEAGLLIQRVANNSPGDLAGLETGKIPVQIGSEEFFIGGDIILEVMGIPISTDKDIMSSIRKKVTELPPGSSTEFKVLRAGKIIHLAGPK